MNNLTRFVDVCRLSEPAFHVFTLLFTAANNMGEIDVSLKSLTVLADRLGCTDINSALDEVKSLVEMSVVDDNLFGVIRKFSRYEIPNNSYSIADEPTVFEKQVIYVYV